jgi:hypothetical protein
MVIFSILRLVPLGFICSSMIAVESVGIGHKRYSYFMSPRSQIRVMCAPICQVDSDCRVHVYSCRRNEPLAIERLPDSHPRRIAGSRQVAQVRVDPAVVSYVDSLDRLSIFTNRPSCPPLPLAAGRPRPSSPPLPWPSRSQTATTAPRPTRTRSRPVPVQKPVSSVFCSLVHLLLRHLP